MSLGSQQDYILNNLAYAQQASVQTGLPVDFLLGQSALETGWGSSGNNNPGGITINGNVASYSSPAAGWSAYANLLSSSNYAGAASLGGSGSLSIANYLVGQGYNTVNQNYAQSVASTVSSVDNAANGLGIATSALGISPGAANSGMTANTNNEIGRAHV